MIIVGSLPEGDTQFVVTVDDLPSLRIEDAPGEVYDEARKFYGQQPFELVGAFEGTGQAGYRFAARR
jgi:hypothetical protein